jgi:YHS domain-containing protein
MKRMKKIICILAIAFFAAGSVLGAVQTVCAGTPQTKCPVLGNPINKDVYADYEGKRVYFCCTECLKEFKKDPGKYVKKLEDEGVELEKTPKEAKPKK